MMNAQQPQPAALMEQHRFDELVADAKDFDPDKKFMAANDLSNALLAGRLKESDYTTVVKILLNQLNDDSSEVQGNSIRCLSKIINKLQESQVEDVSKTMIQKVIEDKGEYRDVYATCLKTLINGVPSNYAKAVQPILSYAITGMEAKLKSKEFDVQEELCDILNNLLKKWGNVLSTSNINVKNLTNILMNNIMTSDRSSLKKKSSNCLGSLGLILQKEEVNRVVNELLASIKKPGNSKQILQYLREKQIYVVYTLNSITKNVSRKLSGNLKHMIDIILQDIQNYIDEVEDYDVVIIISEMFEQYLSIIDNLIKGSHEETKGHFQDFVNLSSQLLNFDPNGLGGVSGGGNDMEIEDEEEMEYMSDDQDSDDSSWRVRRAALALIETLVKSESELIRSIFLQCISSQSESCTIVNRLEEKNENIRFTTFSCLQTIIKSIVISDFSTDHQDEEFDLDMNMGLQLVRVKSAVKEFDIKEIIRDIFTNINNILEKEKKVSSGIQVGAFRLIENLTQNLNRIIIDNPDIWKQALSILKRTIENRSSPNELKVCAFSSLRSLLKHNHENNTQHLLVDVPNLFKLVCLGLSQDYFKIVAESFRCLNSLYSMINKQFNSSIQQLIPSIQSVFQVTVQKLNNQEIDQEIKHAVVSCTNSLLVNLANTLSQDQIHQIMQAVSEKVKQDTKKVSVLKLIKKIPLSASEKISAQSLEILNASSVLISEFLAKQDRSLQVASLEALGKILVLHTNRKVVINAKTRANFLSFTKDFLNEKDTWVAQLFLQVSQQLLENSHAADPKSFVKLVEALPLFAASSIVAQTSFAPLYEVFGLVTRYNAYDHSELIKQLLSQTNKEGVSSVAKAIASVVNSVGENQKNIFIKNFINIANNDKNVLEQQIALLSLGEIGKSTNLSTLGNVLNQVKQIIANKAQSEDVRTAASIAFGGIAIGDLETVLPQVIADISSGKEGQYLMLNSLKHIIEHSQTLSQSVIQIIPKLFAATAHIDDSLCNIIASIIGRVTLLNLQEMKPLILQNLHSKIPNTKYTTVASFKYFCTKSQKIDNDLKELVYALLQAADDGDIRTRAAVFKSLNIIAYNLPQAIIAHVNKEEFFVPLQKGLRFFQIREIDFGPFKQKTDEGEPIRHAAFSLLDTAIDQLHYRGVESFEREILEEALNQFAQESSEDIKIMRFQICIKFAKKVPLKVTPFLDSMSEVFLNVLKPYASKNDGDRAVDMIRTGLVCSNVIRVLAEEESNTKYLAYWELVMKTEKYRNIVLTFPTISSN